MIDDEEGLAEQGLTFAMWEGGIERLAGHLPELDKGLSIGDGLVDGSFEIGAMGGRFLFWPVVIGPIWAFMMWIATELEDIPLRNTNMLGQLPKAVWQPFGYDAQDLVWNIFHRVVKGRMGIAPFKGFFELFDDIRCVAASRSVGFHILHLYP